MANKLIYFLIVVVLSGCSSKKGESHGVRLDTDVLDCEILAQGEPDKNDNETEFVLDKVTSFFGLHGLRIYPTESDYESWKTNRKMDICMVSNDTLFIKKCEFPVVEGLPVKLHKSYLVDEVCSLESLREFSLLRDTFCEGGDIGCLSFRNESTCYDICFTKDTAEFVSMWTTEQSVAIDSIRVGDHISKTSLFRDLWEQKHLGDSIHTICIYSTQDFLPSHWNHPLAKEVKQCEYWHETYYLLKDGIVYRIKAYLSDNY